MTSRGYLETLHGTSRGNNPKAKMYAMRVGQPFDRFGTGQCKDQAAAR